MSHKAISLSLLFVFAVASALTGCGHTPAPAVLDQTPPPPADPMAGWTWEVPAPPPPPMAWVAAGPFRKAQRTPETIDAIVIHTTEGRYNADETHEENQARNFRSVIRYFQGNDRNVSAHYVIGPNGEICQMVNETDVAHTQTYYNGRAIGIECAGWSRRPETWTPEMMEALVNLCAYLCVKWDIPAYHPEGTAYEGPYRLVVDENNQRFTGQGLVGHFQVQPWNKSDPGAHFPWDEFSERVRARIREYGVEPIALPPPEEGIGREAIVTARIKEETVTAGEPFTYQLTIRARNAERVGLDNVTFPDFSVVNGLRVLSDPVRAEDSAERVVYEVPLEYPEAGRFSLGASRVFANRTWSDTQTVGVRVEPAPMTQTLEEYAAEKIRLVVRIDDIGFNHSSNMVVERLAEDNGVATAISVLVNTPWLDHAVEVLKLRPDISLGVHTCLNSEWKQYRWGPVLSPDQVPSLVDEWGHFFGTRADLMANNPNLDEVEAEIRAQIDLALAKGLNISYIDHHMGAAVNTPEMRERFEKIAADYGLAISRYFGEVTRPIIYSISPDSKLDHLLAELEKIEEPGLYLLVVHAAVNTPELAVLEDLNVTGLKNMAEHRQAELDALCDPRLREVLDRKGIELVGYDTLQERFLDQMRRPGQ